MDIIDAFLGEHAILFAQINELRGVAQRGEPLDLLKARFETLQPVLEKHAALEDEMLFGRLGEHLEVVADIHYEHSHIHKLTEAFVRAADQQEGRDLLIQALGKMKEHFIQEETRLFPFARAVLPSEELASLLKPWAACRRVLTVAPEGSWQTSGAFHPQRVQQASHEECQGTPVPPLGPGPRILATVARGTGVGEAPALSGLKHT